MAGKASSTSSRSLGRNFIILKSNPGVFIQRLSVKPKLAARRRVASGTVIQRMRERAAPSFFLFDQLLPATSGVAQCRPRLLWNVAPT